MLPRENVPLNFADVFNKYLYICYMVLKNLTNYTFLKNHSTCWQKPHHQVAFEFIIILIIPPPPHTHPGGPLCLSEGLRERHELIIVTKNSAIPSNRGTQKTKNSQHYLGSTLSNQRSQTLQKKKRYIYMYVNVMICRPLGDREGYGPPLSSLAR